MIPTASAPSEEVGNLTHPPIFASSPVAELFDLIAGISTGGILALGLVMPGDGGKPRYKAAELTGLYKKEGSRIFSRARSRLGSLAEEQ